MLLKKNLPEFNLRESIKNNDWFAQDAEGFFEFTVLITELGGINWKLKVYIAL